MGVRIRSRLTENNESEVYAVINQDATLHKALVETVWCVFFLFQPRQYRHPSDSGLCNVIRGNSSAKHVGCSPHLARRTDIDNATLGSLVSKSHE